MSYRMCLPRRKHLRLLMVLFALVVGITGCGSESVSWEDDTSGLMWTREGAGVHVTQQGAEEHCKGLTLEGYPDWQAPTTGRASS